MGYRFGPWWVSTLAVDKEVMASQKAFAKEQSLRPVPDMKSLSHKLVHHVLMLPAPQVLGPGSASLPWDAVFHLEFHLDIHS